MTQLIIPVQQEKSFLRGALLVVGAGLLWGTTGTSQALGPETSNPLAIGALRLLIGGSVLAPIAFLRGGFRDTNWPFLLVFFGGFLVALYQVTFFSAVARTGVAVGTIVGIGSSPIFAGFLELCVFRKNPGRGWLVSTILALCGVVLLVFASCRGGNNVHVDTLGILLATIAGLSYAGLTLVMKLLLQDKKAEEVTAAIFCIGALILSPLLFYLDLSWLNAIDGWLMMLHLGVMATALSYLLFVEGLKTIPVSSAVTLSLTEPMTAGFLGVVLLGEKFSFASSCGLLLIFSGVLVLVFSKRKEI